MEVSRQMLAKVLIWILYNNETRGITLLFKLNIVKDCTTVSLNHALLILIITPGSLVITQFSLNNAPVTLLIIKITISLFVIGLKMSYFPLICLPSCYRTVLDSLLLDSLLSDSLISQPHSKM